MKSKRCLETEQRRFVSPLSMVAAIAGIAACFSVNGSAVAATVNWLDPLGYQKPAPVDVTMPDEATVTNKYYIDLSNGSGTTCSQSSPCAELRSLVGKPGISGGPAYVYVRGTGNGLYLYNDTFYGSVGREIVIKPWGASIATQTSGGTIGCGTKCHDIIIDGGPDLSIKFNSNSTSQSFGMHIQADNVTIYRTEGYCSVGGSNAGIFAIGDFRQTSNVKIINNEMHDCAQTAGNQSSGIYASPGTNGGFTNLTIQNNIIRNMGGEGIEINPRVTSSGLVITGNAIHNTGKQTCSGSWQCRPAITLAVQSGSGSNGTIIENNLLWDTGSGCIWNGGGGNPEAVIYNNTCYDYHKGNESANVGGITSYGQSSRSVVENNIIYAPNGANPFDGSPFSASSNLCASGKSCGSSEQTWSTNSVLSTDQNSSDFLRIGSGSKAVSQGITISSITTDYAGASRLTDSAYDIGALKYPPPPVNVRVMP